MTIGSGSQSYLEVHQAFSPGWTATLDGRALTPVTLDGWQQAWVVPAGAGGQVTMTFTSAGQYRLLLGIAALGVALLVLIAAIPSRRRSRRGAGGADSGAPATAGAAGSRPGPPGLSMAGYGAALVFAAVVLALVGGPAVLAVPVLAVLAWWLPRWLPWLAFAAMGVAGIAALPDLGQAPQQGVGAFSGPAQAAALVALAAALIPVARRRQRRAAPAGPDPSDPPRQRPDPGPEQRYEQRDEPRYGQRAEPQYEQRAVPRYEQGGEQQPRAPLPQRRSQQSPRQYPEQGGDRPDEGYYE